MCIIPTHTIYWLAALRLPGIGPVRLRRWLSLFADIKELFSASIPDLQQAGLNQNEISALKNPDWKTAENDYHWLEASNCHLLSFNDPTYPSLLREIHDAPILLFVKGDIHLLSKPQIAMVGSRHPSVTGYETAEQFARELTKSGLVISSGMALGIDAASHKGALMAGKTIAVMGTGINQVYPASHRKLADEIIANGALVSEFPPNEGPRAKNFPLRNRVLSGLSRGVLVVEAAIRSGSLITAQYAVDQGREVFAIPGSIHNPLAKGCHHLLRQGAKLIETARDIIEELGSFVGIEQTKLSFVLESGRLPQLNVKQCDLLTQIGFETTAVDTIIVRSGLTSSEVSSILLSLELEGYVRTVPGGYIRCVDKSA